MIKARHIKFVDGIYGYSNFPYGEILIAIGKRFASMNLPSTHHHENFWLVSNIGKLAPVFEVERPSNQEVFAMVRLVKKKDRPALLNWIPEQKTLDSIGKHICPVVEICWPGGEARVFYPAFYEKSEPYVGRVYDAKLSNCYALVFDYLTRTGAVPNVPENTLETILEYRTAYGTGIIDSMIAELGCMPVAVPQLGDVIVCATDQFTDSPMHAAIALDDGYMLNHVPGRVSCREKYDGYWQKTTKIIYRPIGV